MKRFLCALVSGLALVVVTSRGIAGPRVEADPNKLYPITPEVGPWVVCAASYMGPKAHQLAREVVFQLRRRDNLPAYFYDYSEEERKQLENYLKDRPRPGRVRIQDQCGVLIGGFPDPDSARKMLTEVKKLKMPDLDDKSFDSMVDPNTGRILRISPFANAFVTRNPTLPRGPQAQEVDPALKPLNEGEEFSLLKNPRPWTLAVKSYYGVSAVNSSVGSGSFLNKLGLSSNSADVLSASGRTAHEMAKTLRKLGFEAWVLHARRESIVTIGGFDDPKDPKIQDALAQLTKLREENIKRQGSDPFQIPLLPLPMRVPKS